MSIEPGIDGRAERRVGESDTARVLGSGDVDVLGTPAVVALCEQAAVNALIGSLSTDETSVGTRIDLEHLAPTAIGRSVVAVARLVGVDGRKLEFDVEASDEAGQIARGRHSRVVVDRERFVRGASTR